MGSKGKIDELIDPSLRDQISSPCLKVFTEVAYKCLHNRPCGRSTMSDVVVSLEGALLSQNYNEELSSEQNKGAEEASDDDSDNDHMFDTGPLEGGPQQDRENMLMNKKISKENLCKAFQWSLRLLTKKKKDHDSTSDSLLWDNCLSTFSSLLNCRDSGSNK